MAVMKCKMCGGDLILTPGSTVAECEYCGSIQTVPSADNEKKLTLFGRANRLRSACEFDKAAGVYEAIVADFPEEAEGYWGLVLCKYGIEYVDDPATGKKIPTCHRSSFESVMEDANFEQALENADVVARKVYRDEAKVIEEIRKGIIEVSSKEDPYDVFICYKETAADGGRTLDSVLAQDIYTALTEKGYRVFFSRITLEDRLGQEYEPYIFAALNSAKVMLAVGTDYEHFNAVWVKNEWSRYLKMMAKGEKKTLIPCFKNIDAYDMPKEFAKLQAQDLGKVGAMQDLLRGIDKLLGAGTQAAPAAGGGVKAEDLNKSFVYNSALDKAAENTIPALKTAIEKMKSISGYMDADSRLQELEEKLKKKKRGKMIKRLVIVGVIAAVIGGGVLFVMGQIRAEKKGYYDRGVAAMEAYKYQSAINYFGNAEDYEDADEREAQARELLEIAQTSLEELVGCENFRHESGYAINVYGLNTDSAYGDVSNGTEGVSMAVYCIGENEFLIEAGEDEQVTATLDGTVLTVQGSGKHLTSGKYQAVVGASSMDKLTYAQKLVDHKLYNSAMYHLEQMSTGDLDSEFEMLMVQMMAEDAEPMEMEMLGFVHPKDWYSFLLEECGKGIENNAAVLEQLELYYNSDEMDYWVDQLLPKIDNGEFDEAFAYYNSGKGCMVEPLFTTAESYLAQFSGDVYPEVPDCEILCIFMETLMGVVNWSVE